MRKSYFTQTVILILFVIIVFCMIQFNHWLSSQVKTADHSIESSDVLEKAVSARLASVAKEAQKPFVADQPTLTLAPPNVVHIKHPGCLHLITMHPTREFKENVILLDGREVARFQSQGEKFFELTGSIPDGVCDFTDNYAGTQGVEHFKASRRHGDYLEYFGSGPKVRRKKSYVDGKVITEEEFYPGGELRMKADYKDALLLSREDQKGKGAVYTNTGDLIFEWQMLNMNPDRYHRVYDRAGGLIEEITFDSIGRRITHRMMDQQTGQMKNVPVKHE